MAGGFSNSIIGGLSALIRAAIRSPNYVQGSTGWSINKDGTAEFNSLTLRGTFDGTDYVINSSGAFFYSGTPAFGNLIASIASAGGTDSFGNGYQSGIVSYADATDYARLESNVFAFVRGTSSGTIQLNASGMLFGGIDPSQSYYFDKDVAIADPNTGNTPETWHSIAGGVGFASTQWSNRGGVYQSCQYRLDVFGNVQMRGRARFTSNGTTGLSSGTVIFTLPPSYQGGGATVHGYAVPAFSSISLVANRVPSVSVNETGTGQVALFGMTSATTNGTVADVDIDGVFRLG